MRNISQKCCPLIVIPHSLKVEVSSFMGSFAMSAGKDLSTFRRSVSKYLSVNKV